jgi:hypothetical protein
VHPPTLPPGISPGPLDFTANQGPLADSVERAPTAPIYVQTGEGSRQAGFCTVDGGLERTLLRLPMNLNRAEPLTTTLPLNQSAGEPVNTAGMETENSENSADLFSETAPGVESALPAPVDELGQDQLRVMAWALRYGTPVNLGRCDALQSVLPRALALAPELNGARLLVDLAATDAAEFGPSAGAVELAALTGQAVAPAGGTGYYRLAAPILHDTNCPGQYLMGQVLDPQGAPAAGVTLVLRDQWGNQASTVSKSGANDFGRFDFPIASSSPHEIYIWVVDSAGNPISPTFTIQHRQGDVPDVPCHHLVIQGG